jgi:hypothetical protein
VYIVGTVGWLARQRVKRARATNSRCSTRGGSNGPAVEPTKNDIVRLLGNVGKNFGNLFTRLGKNDCGPALNEREQKRQTCLSLFVRPTCLDLPAHELFTLSNYSRVESARL